MMLKSKKSNLALLAFKRELLGRIRKINNEDSYRFPYPNTCCEDLSNQIELVEIQTKKKERKSTSFSCNKGHKFFAIPSLDLDYELGQGVVSGLKGRKVSKRNMISPTFCVLCLAGFYLGEDFIDNFTWSKTKQKFNSKNDKIKTKKKIDNSNWDCNECGTIDNFVRYEDMKKKSKFSKERQNGCRTSILSFFENPIGFVGKALGICFHCTDWDFLDDFNLREKLYPYYETLNNAFLLDNETISLSHKCDCNISWKAENLSLSKIKSDWGFLDLLGNVEFCLGCFKFRDNFLNWILLDLDLESELSQYSSLRSDYLRHPIPGKIAEIGMTGSNFLQFLSLNAEWKCNRGHLWEQIGIDKIFASRCTKCKPGGVSQIELDLASELKYLIPDIIGGQKIISARWIRTNRAMAVDMVSYSENIVIEYDGYRYHSDQYSSSKSDRERDIEKTSTLVGAGFTVIRIREDPLCDLPEMKGLHQLKHSYQGKPGNAKYLHSIDSTVAQIASIINSKVN